METLQNQLKRDVWKDDVIHSFLIELSEIESGKVYLLIGSEDGEVCLQAAFKIDPVSGIEEVYNKRVPQNEFRERFHEQIILSGAFECSEYEGPDNVGDGCIMQYWLKDNARGQHYGYLVDPEYAEDASVRKLGKALSKLINDSFIERSS